jgi:uncharacterized protein YndB with AHSA1/START domain
MTTPTPTDRDLVLTRIIDATPEQLYRCWTEPQLITQWFVPKPWSTPEAHVDLRPGGSHVVASPEGERFPNPGVYLEVVPNRKLVSTDAYTAAWTPAAKPFMTLTLTFDDLGDGRTRYTAFVSHWTVEDREQHEAMGFETGWGLCTDQLADLAKTVGVKEPA